jgi:hypothetical protein
MNVFRDPGSAYRIDFAPFFTGPQALDIMLKYGVPGAQTRYRELSAPGAIPTESLFPTVPNSFRVVFPLREGTYTRETGLFHEGLPCSTFGAVSATECFLRRGGEEVRVTKLR